MDGSVGGERGGRWIFGLLSYKCEFGDNDLEIKREICFNGFM